MVYPYNFIFCTNYEYVAVHEVRVYSNDNGKKRDGEGAQS